MLLRLSVTFWVLVGTLASQISAQNVPVTGVKVASGSAVPLRKNINTLQSQGGAAWDLYITALADMYKQDANNQLSYFQIAGIHGRPYIEWNRAGKRTSDGWLGYCPHGENLFLPWHRPYILLFEQRLVETALKLAKTYPAGSRRDEYTKAAQSLRAPYWDWATDTNVPPSTVPRTLKVRVPNGSGTKTIDIDNPLRTFRFPQAALDQRFGSFTRVNNIFRCPSPQSYPDSANGLMRRRAYKQWVYDAFTRSNNFAEFASTAAGRISLEQIHNAVHWDGACGGQFLDADYSAFDPLFMLHHTNVDRLWAYWQFIKPNHAMFGKTYKGQARFSTPSNTNIRPNNPLKPFYQSAGKFHTSDSVKSIKGFGYTYEGLEYWRKNDATMKTDAIALINRMYATGAVRPMLRKRSIDGDDETTRYFAQIKVDVTELQRPCEIGLYANETNVGNFIVMGQPISGTFFGKFALDKAADPEELKDEETKAVVGDLLSSIRIEIRKHDGTIQPLSDVPSLKLELENVDVIPPESNTDLPEYKDAETRTAPKLELHPEDSAAR